MIAGEEGLDRELRWAHVIEMADPSDLLKGGELVLTTGIGAGTRERDQERWIASLIEQGAAAVAVELGSTWRERVPEPVVRACAEAGVPLVAFRRSVRFVEITEAVHAAVLNSQFELLRRGEEIHRRFTELILHGRGVPEILAELAAAVGNPVVLEDAGHELVYYVSGRAGDDVALSAWADMHRAEDRGETPEGALMVDVRLMDSSWGRLIALAVDEPLDDFDRVATERAALAVAIDLLGQQHEEHLRARSRGAFLSDLADGRVEEADARRRAEALGFPGSGRGVLLPVAAIVARPALPPRRRAVVDAAVGRPALGAVVDRLRRAARPARRRPAGAARPRRPRRTTRRSPSTSPGSSTPCSSGAGPARRRRRWPSARRPTRGWRPARACAACAARRARRRRCRRAAGTTRGARASTDLLHDLRDAPELDAFVDEQLGPLLAAGSARHRVLLETLEAYLAAGGRKAQAARTLHLERQSLYLRLHRIEELLGVSLDDEDAVLGLHLAVRALAFRRRRAAA